MQNPIARGVFLWPEVPSDYRTVQAVAAVRCDMGRATTPYSDKGRPVPAMNTLDSTLLSATPIRDRCGAALIRSLSAS